MPRILTGKEFNEKYAGIRFVKLTNKEENHNGYQFKDGLNIDTVPFYTKLNCCAGGIYFCKFDDFPYYLNYNNTEMHFIRNIIIPDDAQVFEETNERYKSDKIILLDREVISFSFENCLSAIKQNGFAFYYVTDQTPEICLVAIKLNAHVLEGVHHQTPEICLVAVKQNGFVLEYVKEQTPEICLEAVKQNGHALYYVVKQTPEICLAAVQQDGDALLYVKH